MNKDFFLAGLTNPLSSTDFSALLGRISTQIGFLIGGIGTIMLIVAGIMFLLSAGSPEKVNRAKAAATYAIIGIAIGIAAKPITDAILDIIK